MRFRGFVGTVPFRCAAIVAVLVVLVSCVSGGSDADDVGGGSAGVGGAGAGAAGGGDGTAGAGATGAEGGMAVASGGGGMGGTGGATGPDLGEPTLTFEDYSAARYCEVLIARAQGDGTLLADVYNSLAFNDCPQDLWDALDVSQIESDFPDAALVVLNGPRFLLMQELYGSDVTPMGVHDFGGIQMVLVATVEFDPDSGSAYTDTRVNRSTTFRFKRGVRVYELLSPDGGEYIMQSFSRIVDPNLAFEELETLGERLAPPGGWTYRTRVLDADFDVTATGIATVLTDDLTNTYQLVE